MEHIGPEDIINRLAESQEAIEFAITPGRALILISQLQLALRHPENKGPSTEIARQMISNMAQVIATATDTPEVLEIVAMGSHPEFDMKDEEADQYFGTEVQFEVTLEQTDVTDEEILEGRAVFADPLPVTITKRHGGLMIEPEGHGFLMMSLDLGYPQVVIWDSGEQPLPDNPSHEIRLNKLPEQADS